MSFMAAVSRASTPPFCFYRDIDRYSDIAARAVSILGHLLSEASLQSNTDAPTSLLSPSTARHSLL